LEAAQNFLANLENWLGDSGAGEGTKREGLITTVLNKTVSFVQFFLGNLSTALYFRLREGVTEWLRADISIDCVLSLFSHFLLEMGTCSSLDVETDM